MLILKKIKTTSLKIKNPWQPEENYTRTIRIKVCKISENELEKKDTLHTEQKQ